MKKLLHNIYTFLHVSINWNVWLAVFIFWHEARRGRKYGINTIKPIPLKKLTITQGETSKSSPYEAVSYYLLEKLLEKFCVISNERTITDLGSGKGRVLVAAAHFGFTSLHGVEFAHELCDAAESNLQLTSKKIPGIRWNIHCEDVLNYQVSPEESVFFLFNPFQTEILRGFLKRLQVSLIKHPRTTWFVYASPVHVKELLDTGYQIVYHHHPTLGKLEGMILEKVM